MFTSLLSKEVTRKEFLLHLSVLLLAVTGISSLIKTLSDPHLVDRKLTRHKSGFGSGPYGV